MFKLEMINTISGKSIVLKCNEEREVLEKQAEEMGWEISDDKDDVWEIEVNEMSEEEYSKWEDPYDKYELEAYLSEKYPYDEFYSEYIDEEEYCEEDFFEYDF